MDGFGGGRGEGKRLFSSPASVSLEEIVPVTLREIDADEVAPGERCRVVEAAPRWRHCVPLVLLPFQINHQS